MIHSRYGTAVEIVRRATVEDWHSVYRIAPRESERVGLESGAYVYCRRTEDGKFSVRATCTLRADGGSVEIAAAIGEAEAFERMMTDEPDPCSGCGAPAGADCVPNCPSGIDCCGGGGCNECQPGHGAAMNRPDPALDFGDPLLTTRQGERHDADIDLSTVIPLRVPVRVRDALAYAMREGLQWSISVGAPYGAKPRRNASVVILGHDGADKVLTLVSLGAVAQPCDGGGHKFVSYTIEWTIPTGEGR